LLPIPPFSVLSGTTTSEGAQFIHPCSICWTFIL